MDNLKQTLKRDWEKTLLGTMVFALLVSLALWFRGSAPSQDSGSGGKAKSRHSYLGNSALAFLDPVEVPRIPDNPFSFGYKAEVKRPWRINRNQPTKPENNTPTKPNTPAKPTPLPPAGANTPKVPTKPAPPPPARVLTYRGYMESATGKMVAFVGVLDPATKKSRMEQLSVGRDIEGIEVKDFSGDQLEIVAPNGKAMRIPKGGRRKIVLE